MSPRYAKLTMRTCHDNDSHINLTHGQYIQISVSLQIDVMSKNYLNDRIDPLGAIFALSFILS